MRRVALLFVPMACGCASKVIGEYTDLRMETLADPGPVPDGWAPDAALVLSPQVVEEVVGAAMKAHGDLSGEVAFEVPLMGTASLLPDLHVTKLAIGPGATCDRCVAVQATLEGDVGWRLGQKNGRAPVTATADLDTEFATTRQSDGTFLVTARPQRVRDLDVSVGGTSAVLGPFLGGALGDWLQEDLGSWVQPIPLGTVGGEDVPLRAARVRAAGEGIAIDLLTRSTSPVGLVPPTSVASGWELHVSSDSLLDVARRESFLYGPVGHGVVVDPKTLAFTDEGLVLGMRLWWTKGRGWWRDYAVVVALELGEKDLKLTATDVREMGHSKGAAWADPLAALAEGKILDGIERAIRATAPAGWSGAAGDVEIVAGLREVDGSGGAVRLSGDLHAQPVSGDAPSEEPAPEPGKKPKSGR